MLNRLLIALPTRLLHCAATQARRIQRLIGYQSDADRLAAALDHIDHPTIDPADVNQAVTDYLTTTPAGHYQLITPQHAEDEADAHDLTDALDADTDLDPHWYGNSAGFQDGKAPRNVPIMPPIHLDPTDPDTKIIRAALDEALHPRTPQETEQNPPTPHQDR